MSLYSDCSVSFALPVITHLLVGHCLHGNSDLYRQLYCWSAVQLWSLSQAFSSALPFRPSVSPCKYTCKFCIQQQFCPSYCTIHSMKGGPLTPDGCASPQCSLLHLGNDAIGGCPIVLPTGALICESYRFAGLIRGLGGNLT